MQRSRIRKKLQSYIKQPGNWRLKGLLLALQENSRAVGEAWPTNAEARRALMDRAPPRLGKLGVEPQPAVSKQRHLGHEPGSVELESVRQLSSFNGDDVRALQQGQGLDYDDYISRALVDDSPSNLDVTWREELTETIVAGKAVHQVAREAATVDPVEAKRGDLPTRNEIQFAQQHGEGAEAEFDETNYKQTSYNCKKFTQGFRVTDELEDQAEPALIEEHISRSGRALENGLNRLFINTLLDNATDYDADISGAGSTDILDLLMKASEEAADEDFDPTNVLVMHPEYLSELAGNNQFASADINRVDGDASDILGHRPYTLSGTVYNSGSVTYGFETDAERGALVYNSEFVRIPMYRDIEVNRLPDRFTNVRDVMGGVASMWADVVAVDPDDDGTFESVIRVQR